MSAVESQQVSFWPVHEWVAPRLERVGTWPILGSPAWVLLDDRDPVKWAAVLDGGQHYALRLELNQEALAQASRDISAAADWSAISREIRIHTDFYAAKPWLKREAS
jgi:hypothetical protein